MRIWMLATGAAALAIAPPALAERGGHGGGHGQNNKSQVQRGGGGSSDRAQARGSRGGGGERAQMRSANRGGDRIEARSANRGGDRANRQFVQKDNRGHGQMKADRVRSRDDNQANRFRAQGNDNRQGFRGNDKHNQGQAVRSARFEDRGNRGRDFETRGDRRNGARFVNQDHIKDRANFRWAEGEKVFRVRDNDRGIVRYRDVDRDQLFARRVGWNDGCPPGLAKKNLACLPPGQAARFVGQPLVAASRIAALDPLPVSLRSLYYDDDDYYYRYGGGYLYRVDRGDDLISSIVPLFGAALLGQPLQPSYVNSYYRPSYYNAFYPNSPYDCYQYGYGYVYETDCMTGMVEDVIPTYDRGYGVGQLLPSSYSYYNVPYAYRGYYPDTNDYYYRYAPGAIYQVDRSTSLISAVASLLTGGLTVGQPLPVGYSAYNVPYAYRTSYYDTPDTWYRYDNGYIYAVDPTTQLVRSIVQAIV